jgi:MoaA/NifB/PqqE/SkfB family radical SAM enzyme
MVRSQARAGRTGWVAGLPRHYALIVLSRLLGRPLCGPILGTLVTNYSCNLRCRMCGMPERHLALRGRGEKELSTGEMLEVIDGFAGLGCRGVGVTGGEPLLRPDIFTLLRRIVERGMLGHLNTNGTLLDAERTRELLASGTHSLNISLDGADAETHDRIRGIPGSFALTVAAVRRVVEERGRTGARLRVKVVAVLSEDNLEGVEDYLAFAASLGVDCAEFIPRQSFPEGAGGGIPASSAVLGRVEETVRRLGRKGLPLPLEDSRRMLRLFLPAFRAAPSPLSCWAGYNSLAVDCFGRAFPCVPRINWDQASGQVCGSSLPALWRSPAYAEVRRSTQSCHDCTLNCQAELNLLFQPFRIS